MPAAPRAAAVTAPDGRRPAGGTTAAPPAPPRHDASVIDLLLLDYNGVIVDDEPIHFAALREVLAVERVALDREIYDAAYLGLDDRACVRLAFERARRPLDAEGLRLLSARKARWYADRVRTGLPLVAGVREFVRGAAAAGARVGVVSAALRREIAAGLAAAGLGDVVTAVVSAEDVRAGKPDPEGYRIAITRLAGDAPALRRVVAVEDSLPGLAAARAAGAGCVLLATSHRRDRLSGGDAVWDSFAGHAPHELLPLFRDLAA